ncbi:hypothetical protein LUZ61_020933 [Rhynchospora tenuis]|uniref:Thioredoxin-like protein n=1 Tax=Rhynchospora tenuis TaxID=198213 RepID=A0AAD5ZEB1_9POAL|nr:hypothetical protein LUZ61_020933 [Rhynchospora tenuis]
MLTFFQTVKPLSNKFTKTLNPTYTYTPTFSFPITITISPKLLCLSETSFPTIAASSTSPSHSNAGTNPNSIPLKSNSNGKKRTKSVTSGEGKVRDLSGVNNRNGKIIENDPDLDEQAPNPSGSIPYIKPRKPRRGRRSEAQATEDFIRNQLEQTFTSIRAKNPDLDEKIGKILDEKLNDSESYSDGDKDSDEDREIEEGAKKGYVEEEDPEWPLDAEVGWGIRASDYFEKHPIKNVVENGVEIDWEGELDYGWVQEINCLEWESFAFHPSPLVVLVFERYKRAADNWKFLMEFEKAAKIYWSCKDRLPPRTVKIDVNIETDLAYALKVTESDCPQLLFLRGNQILYRQKEIRCADDLVRMIAHFYYNAKRPEWMDPAAVASP